MSDPFLSEIRAVGFNFAPIHWATCDGQAMAINQNTALFSLLGTNFGGNGITTFNLPNLQGDTPMHWGSGPGLTPRNIGETGGETTHTLTRPETPNHTHSFSGSTATGTLNSPNGALLAEPACNAKFASLYHDGNGSPTPVQMNASMLSSFGNSQPHNNLQPYLTMNFIIALSGIFPARS